MIFVTSSWIAGGAESWDRMGTDGKGGGYGMTSSLEFICYALAPSVTGFGDEALKVKWGHGNGPSLSERRRERR